MVDFKAALEAKDDEADAMTVVSLTVDNFKRLRAARVHPRATGLVPVRGKNAQGKSSLIESMLAALLGAKAKQDLPIREGEHGAQVVLDLGDIVVKRRWTRDSGGKAKTSLTVEDADGVQQKSPQGILESLVGRFADPVAFLSMSPADQVKTVLGITGLDAALQELKLQAETLYDSRTEIGRDATRSKKALEELETELGGIGLPSEGEGASVTELSQQLRDAKDRNSLIDSMSEEMERVKASGKELVARLADLKREQQHVETEIEERRVTWREMEAKLKELTPIDIEPIMTQMADAEEMAKVEAKLEVLNKARSVHRSDAARHDDICAKLNAKRGEIKTLLGGASFPVDGMSYDHDANVVTLNGIPFGNASQAERLKAAAAIAMAGSPRIKVLFAREGSLLDEESRAALAEMSEAAGFQLWLEVVDSKRDGAGIFIEDGEAFE